MERKQKAQDKEKTWRGKKTVTTYSYSKGWSSNLIDSSNFKKSTEHQNLGSIPNQSKEFVYAAKLGHEKAKVIFTQINPYHGYPNHKARTSTRTCLC